MMPSLRERFDRVAYRAQQLSILVPCTMLQEGARVVSGQQATRVRHLPAIRYLQQRYFELLARDLANVEAGLYPRELLYQIPVRHYLRTLPRLVRDAPRVLARYRKQNHRDIPDVNDERYPSYYRRTFHWQTDGYLSRHSAELYDLEVELLFRGMADVMRRQIIPPISRFLVGKDVSGMRLCDVACGTGRTLKQLAAAHPKLRFYGVDISPYYIQTARKVLCNVPDVSLVAENAETLPFVDGHFDVVTCVYLFHELPRAVRRRVFSELYRVLKPGGLLVVEDSAQPADSGPAALFLRNFPKQYHEPFYADYLDDELGDVAREIGFTVDAVEPHLVAKVMVATRPR
jgi:ubiquinone/menaquinone biosynthesis C-methylase UbiE